MVPDLLHTYRPGGPMSGFTWEVKTFRGPLRRTETGWRRKCSTEYYWVILKVCHLKVWGLVCLYLISKLCYIKLYPHCKQQVSIVKMFVGPAHLRMWNVRGRQISSPNKVLCLNKNMKLKRDQPGRETVSKSPVNRPYAPISSSCVFLGRVGSCRWEFYLFSMIYATIINQSNTVDLCCFPICLYWNITAAKFLFQICQRAWSKQSFFRSLGGWRGYWLSCKV